MTKTYYYCWSRGDGQLCSSEEPTAATFTVDESTTPPAFEGCWVPWSAITQAGLKEFIFDGKVFRRHPTQNWYEVVFP